MDTQTKRKYALAALALVVIVAAAVAVRRGGTPGASGPLVDDELALTRTLSRGQERPSGQLYLSFTRRDDREAYRYVNVAVDLNGDGAFAAYDADGGRQEEWLVRDMASFAAVGGSNGFRVAIPDRDIGRRLPANAMVAFSAAPMGGDAWPQVMPETARAQEARLTSYAVDDRDESFVTDGKGERDTGLGGGASRRLAVVTSASANDRDEPTEYNARNEGIPDQNQKYNECSPTGISDNFRWLAKKYGFEDRMPSSTESLINELKGDLQWDNGVTPGQNTIDGKNAFIRRHGLPLEAHMIGGEFDRNIQYKIAQEIQKGQAVEVGMLFVKTVDGREVSDGAHLVGVSSTLRFGSDRFIQLVDPGTRARPDGENAETYRLDGNEVVGYDDEVKTVIRFAYAQSPVRDGTGSLVYPVGANDFVLDPGDELTPAGSDLTLARGSFGFFNVGVDHPGDHMVGESFDVVASVTSTGRKTTMGYWVGDERREYTFGAGSPWSLKGHFIGSSVIAPEYVLLKPDRMDVRDRRYRVEARFTCARPGLARVTYVADLFWPRDGAVVPADLHGKYEQRVRSQSETLLVESPPFRCVARPAPPTDQPRTAGFTCPGVTPTTDGVIIDVLVLDGQCYPASQFHVGQPDNCKKRHWHWNGTPVVSFEGVKKNDPNTSGCGFGDVDELKAQSITVGSDDASKFLGGVMER